MRDIDWRALAVLTLRAPREAAAIVLSWQLQRDVLYTALALVVLINTVLFSLTNMILPSQMAVMPIYGSPLALYVVMLGSFILIIQGLFWTGRALGGQGNMGDLLALMTWMQALQVAVQLAQLFLLLISPMLTSLLSLVMSLWFVWIMVQFIAVAFRFDNAWRAAGVLMAALTGLALGLMFLGTLIGVSALEGAANV